MSQHFFSRAFTILTVVFILELLCVSLLVGMVSAVPTTGAVTINDPGQVTFTATGGSGAGWFEWGKQTGHLIWSTPNQTVSGAFSDTQTGAPMLVSNTYLVRACDSTGCGSEVSFAVPNATVIDQTSFGSGLVQIMRSGFNISQSIPIMMQPYTNNVGGTYGSAIVWGMLFMFIFTAYWMRAGDITIPMMLAFLFGSGMIWGANGLGLPPMFMDVGIGICAASLAGMFFSWFTK